MPAGMQVPVNTSDDALQAISRARPGDVITMQPGTYRFVNAPIEVSRWGTSAAPITLRAERPGSVLLEFLTTEGFRVSAPYWRFENLAIRGACLQDSDCEHAFHVVGDAAHFVARNNTLTDFNAHFKINGDRGHFPDHGLIEGNTISNVAVRATDNPVTTIDLVGASHWTIRDNLIADFVKGQGDGISYGAFAKGAGSDNHFQGNIVICELLLRGAPGQRVGLSLGGGGTGPDYCRDGRCITEQDESVIESNLIASCSDDGVYLNQSTASKVLHNTIIDTGGVSVRFAESTAEIEGNLVDGAVRSRDAGIIHGDDNMQTSLLWLYVGRHPMRDLYRDASALDFGWRGDVPRRVSQGPASPDLCGATRPRLAAYGAFEDFSACSNSKAKGRVP